jgi:competence protein ComEA
VRTSYYILIGVIAGFLLAGALVWVSRSPSGKPIELLPAPTQAPLVVHVVGAVPRPGVYELPEGSRVRDAIQAAGGLLAQAETSSINLAAPLEDGQKLEVPFEDGPLSNDLPAAPESTAIPNQAELVDINTASLEELDTLPGIGPTTAEKIIEYRDENGPFQSIEDILNVSGIGPATFEEIKDLIKV